MTQAKFVKQLLSYASQAYPLTSGRHGITLSEDGKCLSLQLKLADQFCTFIIDESDEDRPVDEVWSEIVDLIERNGGADGMALSYSEPLYDGLVG